MPHAGLHNDHYSYVVFIVWRICKEGSHTLIITMVSVEDNLKINIEQISAQLDYLAHKKADVMAGRGNRSVSIDYTMKSLIQLDETRAYNEDRLMTLEGILQSINDTNMWTESTLSTLKALTSGILGKAKRTTKLSERMNGALDDLGDSISDLHFSDTQDTLYTAADLAAYTSAYKCQVAAKEIPSALSSPLDAGRGRVAASVHRDLGGPAVCGPSTLAPVAAVATV